MASLQRQTVTVYTVWCDGRPLAVSLDRDSLVAKYKVQPNSRRKKIVVHEEEVGVIEGELFDWNAGLPGAPRVKLHWWCPQCGQQNWEDWSPDISNPFFCDTLCRCVDSWLVSWSLSPVNFATNPHDESG